METNKLIVNRILQVHEPSAKRLGLDRLEENRLILAFGRWAEGRRMIEGLEIPQEFAQCVRRTEVPRCFAAKPPGVPDFWTTSRSAGRWAKLGGAVPVLCRCRARQERR
jgi:hypothetical protein